MDMEIAFRRSIAEKPADWTTRLIFADWLEEQGRSAAAAFQRWVVERKTSPWSSETGKSWFWMSSGEENYYYLFPPEVPWYIFELLDAKPVHKGKLTRAFYRSEQRAWEDLEKAYLWWFKLRMGR